MYTIFSFVNGEKTQIVSQVFEDRKVLEELIQYPLVTDTKVFRPEEMFVEDLRSLQGERKILTCGTYTVSPTGRCVSC